MRCPPRGPADVLAGAALVQRLSGRPLWQVVDGALERQFQFADFHHTMAFVNAVAWIAHGADHHPDLEVGFNRCRVRWRTHSAGGVTDSDFSCAARIDALLE